MFELLISFHSKQPRFIGCFYYHLTFVCVSNLWIGLFIYLPDFFHLSGVHDRGLSDILLLSTLHFGSVSLYRLYLVLFSPHTHFVPSLDKHLCCEVM